MPEPIKDERYQRFMERAGSISAARLEARVGRRCRVLVDAVERGAAIARSAGEAPEIDGIVRVRGGGKLPVGEFTDVEITAAGTYDLEARPV